MRPLSYFRVQVQRLYIMAKGKLTFNVRLSRAAIDEIDRLVDETKYSSRSDLVSRAVYELLQKEGLRPVIREEIKSFFKTAEGKEIIKEIIDGSK